MDNNLLLAIKFVLNLYINKNMTFDRANLYLSTGKKIVSSFDVNKSPTLHSSTLFFFCLCMGMILVGDPFFQLPRVSAYERELTVFKRLTILRIRHLFDS